MQILTDREVLDGFRAQERWTGSAHLVTLQRWTRGSGASWGAPGGRDGLAGGADSETTPHKGR